MAFSINLYKFNKRTNSTKQPDNTVPVLATTCELKTSCSLFQPVITFDALSFSDQGALKTPMEYTYAKIQEFNRYYWVSNWTWANGLWIATLTCDVLASFKTDIGSSYQYILRSASDYNSDIADNKYITYYKSNATNSIEQTENSHWKVSLTSPTMTNGFFIVGVVNNDSAAIGATSYYYFSPKSMRYFLGRLMAAPTWLNITDASLSADLQKIMFNPMQYIVSCIYIPMELPASFRTQANMITDLPIGWWSIDLSGADAMTIFRATQQRPADNISFSMTIPRHPDAATRKYLKLSPYSEYTLEIAPFGVIALDSTKLYGNDTLNVSIRVDFITGRGTLRLRCGSGRNFYYAVAQVGIPISIAQITLDRSTITSGGTWLMSAGITLANNHDLIEKITDYSNTAADLQEIWAEPQELNLWDYISPGAKQYQDTVGYAMEKTQTTAPQSGTQSITQSITKDLGDILNAAIASAGSCNYSGQTGGFDSYTDYIRLILHYCDVAPEMVSRYGKPLCEQRQINTLSGYVLCATADIEYNAIPFERDLVRAYLTGGFYYE